MVLKTDTVTRPPKQDVLTSLRTAISLEMKNKAEQKQKNFAQLFAETEFIFGYGPSNLSEREVRKGNYYKDLEQRHQSRQD